MPSNDRIITTSMDKTCIIYDLIVNKPTITLNGHTGVVSSSSCKLIGFLLLDFLTLNLTFPQNKSKNEENFTFYQTKKEQIRSEMTM